MFLPHHDTKSGIESASVFIERQVKHFRGALGAKGHKVWMMKTTLDGHRQLNRQHQKHARPRMAGLSETVARVLKTL